MSQDTKLSALKRSFLSHVIQSKHIGSDDLSEFTASLLAYPDHLFEKQHRDLFTGDRTPHETREATRHLRNIIWFVYKLSFQDLAKGLKDAHQVSTDDNRDMITSVR